MKYRVVKNDAAVIGVYEAASEDDVLEMLGADASSGFASRAAAEEAALAGAILIEAAE